MNPKWRHDHKEDRFVATVGDVDVYQCLRPEYFVLRWGDSQEWGLCVVENGHLYSSSVDRRMRCLGTDRRDAALNAICLLQGVTR